MFWEAYSIYLNGEVQSFRLIVIFSTGYDNDETA